VTEAKRLLLAREAHGTSLGKLACEQGDFGVLAALALLVDFMAGAFGVKRFGASGRAVTGATIGAIVGLFFGIVGVLVGPFIGAVIGELSVRRNLAAASRAGVGAALGMALGTAAKLAIALAMIGVIIYMRLF